MIATAPGLAALACFVPYLLLSAFAEQLMDAPLVGGLNTGTALGLLQLAGFLGCAARAPKGSAPEEPSLGGGNRPAEPQP